MAADEQQKSSTERRKETNDERIARLRRQGFQPGVSGNPKGRPKKKTLEEELRDVLGDIVTEQIGGVDVDVTKLRRMAEHWAERVLGSDKALIALADRLWPATKKLEHTGSFEHLMAGLDDGDGDELEEIEDGEPLGKLGEGGGE